MNRPNGCEQFMAKVAVDKYTGCWHWQGYLDHSGYGHFSSHGRRVLAHRWAYEHFTGVAPKDTLTHKCHVRNCVNWQHLVDVTQAENAAMVTPQRKGVRKALKLAQVAVDNPTKANIDCLRAALMAVRKGEL